MTKYERLREKIINASKLTQEERKRLQIKSTDESIINPCMQTDPNKIIPRLVEVDSKHKKWKVWKAVEEHVASFEFRRSPGRNMFFLIENAYDGTTLGIIDVAADFLSLGNRDRYIGWDVETRKVKNKNIANISICVPTRFFGYNLVGGKLLTLLAASDEVAAVWKRRYGDTLVGITVTSLYGKSAQYNGLRLYKYLGKTQGQGTVQIPDDIYREMRQLVEEVEGKIPGGQFTKGRNSRINIIRAACDYLGIDSEEITSHGHRRGVYWCERFSNSNEWLRGETDTLIERGGMDVESLTNEWRDNHAFKRIENLKRRGTFPVLF